jgi:hypothetical protein
VPLTVDELRDQYETTRPFGWRCSPPLDAQLRDGSVYRYLGYSRGEVVAPKLDRTDERFLIEVIERQKAFFAERGLAFTWKVHSYDSPLLEASLVAAGFYPIETVTVLVAEAAAVDAPANQLPDGIFLRRVTDRSELEGVAAVQASVGTSDRIWDRDPEEISGGLAPILDSEPDRIQILSVEHEGGTVGSAWVTTKCDGVAEFSGVAILRPWRRRGIYPRLIAERMAFVQESEAAFVLADASTHSLPTLLSAGFVPIGDARTFLCGPT